MLQLRLLIIPFFTGIFLLCSCKKNTVEETYIPIITPVTPDFGSKITSAVNGFITDENGDAVEGATITAGTATTTTDQYGYFRIDNTLFAKSAGFVQVIKDGYFAGYRTFVPVPRKQTFIRLQLTPKTDNDIIESLSGGTVSFNGNASVTLPANAVVFGSNNAAYTGPVNVAAHWFDPSDMQNTSLSMPGDLTGVDSAGHLNVLQTFGMVAVELTGTNGQPLKIAPGKKALLHFPLPTSLQGAAPRYIPLWYFDETKGVWQQEAHAVKNGNAYDAEVAHFSYWNCDVGFPLVNFTAQFVDAQLRPLINTPIMISEMNATGVSRSAFTDTNGMAYGLIPANSSLKLDLFSTCNQIAFTKAFTTTNAPVDLGTIPVNTAQYGVTIEGTVTDCNGTPVTSGYVIVAGFSNNALLPVNNGKFSITRLMCPPLNASAVAVDRETGAQSQVKQISLNPGINNIGELQACGSAQTEIINIGYNTSAIMYTLPQYLFGGNFYFANDSTSINAIDLLNGNQQVFQLSFTGTATPGTHQLANNRLAFINGTNWIFDAGTTINISSYGLVGQSIIGSLTGTATRADQAGITRTYDIQFTIQRDQ